MLYCASYFQPSDHHGKLISISISKPQGFEIDQDLDIFKPSPMLQRLWKTQEHDHTAWAEYRRQFWALIEERKDPVLEWIDSLGHRPQEDMTLLCWEKPREYCHRNLIAQLCRKHCLDFFGGCDVPQFKIGDRVRWPWVPSHLTFLEPFEIRAIEGSCAYLSWLSPPVKLAELKKI